ncbi:MAG: hypothetical protein V7L20_05090 [Nostoc sp.]|uniref:hypothetical protein n=1 Tax=Nostoc sp. TaxID=1180 RepID=UPI002FF5BF56
MAYRDISRGVRLAADHAKYIAWLEKDTAARQEAFASVSNPANKVKTDRVSGYIIPFDSTGAQLAYVPAKLIKGTQTGRGSALALEVGSIVAAYTFDLNDIAALTTPNLLDGVKQFKCAKLTVIQRVTTATEKKASRITGRLYYRHENDSVTTVFGKKLATDTYQSVKEALIASNAFKTLIPGTGSVPNRYRFVPEAV